MGIVVLAEDTLLGGDQVALKFLPPEIRNDLQARAGLRQETKKARKLTHENIVRIHDFQEPPGEDPFIVMEFVSGVNMSDLKRQKPNQVFSWNELRPFVGQLLAALGFAHSKGVIHRDLKPSNLQVDESHNLKLLDFGIAAVLTDSFRHVAGDHHQCAGTPPYMSPQQARGELPGFVDDIYSVGATLYDLLTGEPPFKRPEDAEKSLPEPLEKRLIRRKVVNPIPSHVAEAVMQCLARKPAKRPQSAGELMELLGLVEIKEVRPAGKLRRAIPVAAVVGFLLWFGWQWLHGSKERHGLQKIVAFAQSVPSYKDKFEAVIRLWTSSTNSTPLEFHMRGNFTMMRTGGLLRIELTGDHPRSPKSANPKRAVTELLFGGRWTNSFSLWSQSNIVTICHHESQEHICYTNYSLDLLNTNHTRDVIKQLVGYTFKLYSLLLTDDRRPGSGRLIDDPITIEKDGELEVCWEERLEAAKEGGEKPRSIPGYEVRFTAFATEEGRIFKTETDLTYLFHHFGRNRRLTNEFFYPLLLTNVAKAVSIVVHSDAEWEKAWPEKYFTPQPCGRRVKNFKRIRW